MSVATPNTKPTKPTKLTQAQPQLRPVEILPGQYSHSYTNLHPVLLLSILLFGFRSLVADPVNTLLGLAPTVAILQLLYCVLCLPSSGQAPPPAIKPGQKKKHTKQGQDFGAKVVPAFLSLFLTLTLATPVLYIIVILFGAPLTTHHPHTLLLALHLALLTTSQLFYVQGLDAPTWLRISSLQLPLDEMYGMSLGACAGAWLGAVPIPLDWDREWQKWPVTIIIGLYIGAVVGKLVGGYLVKGWKIKLS